MLCRSDFAKKLPFETDADLGIRSGDDIYVRLKAKRAWVLRNDFSFYAEQIYRYGIDSKNYFRTNLELTHARPNEAFLSNQFSLTHADEQEDDWWWDNRLFRQHQFFANQRFNYGIYMGGYYNDNDLRLNSRGRLCHGVNPCGGSGFMCKVISIISMIIVKIVVII